MQAQTKEQLQDSIVDLILDSVNLRHKDKSQITASTPLVGEGLGLDSLDILEIVVAVEKKYGVRVNGAEEGKTVFRSVGSLTDFVEARGKFDA